MKYVCWLCLNCGEAMEIQPAKSGNISSKPEKYTKCEASGLWIVLARTDVKPEGSAA